MEPEAIWYASTAAFMHEVEEGLLGNHPHWILPCSIIETLENKILKSTDINISNK